MKRATYSCKVRSIPCPGGATNRSSAQVDARAAATPCRPMVAGPSATRKGAARTCWDGTCRLRVSDALRYRHGGPPFSFPGRSRRELQGPQAGWRRRAGARREGREAPRPRKGAKGRQIGDPGDDDKRPVTPSTQAAAETATTKGRFSAANRERSPGPMLPCRIAWAEGEGLGCAGGGRKLRSAWRPVDWTRQRGPEACPANLQAQRQENRAGLQSRS